MKYAIAGSVSRAGPLLQVLTAQCQVEEDWNHASLRAPYWRAYWNKTVGASIVHRRRTIALEPGRVFLIPPETDFSSKNSGPFIHFYIHFLCGCRWSHHTPVILPVTPDLRAILDALIPSQDLAWNEWLLLALLGRCLGSLPANGWDSETDTGHAGIRRALDYLRIHLPAATPTTVLAAKAGMNLNAFIRLFRERLGETPSMYQRRQRIDAACILLHHSGESIEAVAEACGFCDRHHFTRVFKSSRGMGPAEFRKLVGGSQNSELPAKILVNSQRHN